MLQRTSPSTWDSATSPGILRWPLPYQSGSGALMMRAVGLLARHRVLSISGLEHVAPERDPFILALNHSTRTEAILVPTLLMLHRGGRLLHFVADWNYALIPGIGTMYRRAETVLVTRKPARPAFLNAFKPQLSPTSALARARKQLAAGRSVGIFPEGRVNRDPSRLLPGRRGAALLSLELGIPLVPAGIRFPRSVSGQPLSDADCMAVEIGPALAPPRPAGHRVTPAELCAWHGVLMGELARLSRKSIAAELSPSERLPPEILATSIGEDDAH